MIGETRDEGVRSAREVPPPSAARDPATDDSEDLKDSDDDDGGEQGDREVVGVERPDMDEPREPGRLHEQQGSEQRHHGEQPGHPRTSRQHRRDRGRARCQRDQRHRARVLDVPPAPSPRSQVATSRIVMTAPTTAVWTHCHREKKRARPRSTGDDAADEAP